VAVILLVKPLPETVNCCTLGFADAVPAQADIVPLAAPAVMVGVGFTVIVKVTGVPGQLAPGVIKAPTAVGEVPAVIVVVTVLVTVLITDTLFELKFVTYRLPPSGLTVIPAGAVPTAMLAATVLVAVLTTDTLLEPWFVT